MPPKKANKPNNSSKKQRYYRPHVKNSSPPEKEEVSPVPTLAGLVGTESNLPQDYLEEVRSAKESLPSLENFEDYIKFFKEVGEEAEENPTKPSHRRAALSSEAKYDTYLEKALNLPQNYITELPEFRAVCFLALYYELVQKHHGEQKS